MLAKMILRARFPQIVDYDQDMEMQKRGIDLMVEGLGMVEVKTDYHTTPNFFIEVSVGPKPGTIDHSCADIIAFIFPRLREMFLIPRPHIVKWMRENWYWLRKKVKSIKSYQGKSRWTAEGVVVNRQELIDDVREMGGKVIIISWDESEEILAQTTWEGGNGR
jgi:hypothetical protein